MRFSGRRFDRRRPWGDQSSWGRLVWSRATRLAGEKALGAVDAAASRSQHMMDSATATRRGTRRRALPLMATGFAALAGMFTLVSQDVLAVNFTTSDQTFKLYSNYVQGVSGAGYLATNGSAGADGKVGVAELGFKSAVLSGLCAIAHQSVPVVGDVSLVLTAGVPVASTFDNSGNQTTDGAGKPIAFNADGTLADAATNIAASNLYLNSNNLSAFGNKISGLNLGQSADSVAGTAGITWPAGNQDQTAGGFGLSADHLNLGGLGGDTYGIDLQGQITLPKLKIKVVPGTKTQADCSDGGGE